MARKKNVTFCAQNTNDAPCARGATSAKTVFVSLYRASGVVFFMPDGRRVRVASSSARLRGKEKGVLPIGEPERTEINADDWEYIEKTYGPHMDLFKNNHIFAEPNERDAIAHAKELGALRHGLEPVSVGASGATQPYDGAGV